MSAWFLISTKFSIVDYNWQDETISVLGCCFFISVKIVIYAHEYLAVFLLTFINVIIKRSYHADEEVNVTVDSNSSLPLT